MRSEDAQDLKRPIFNAWKQQIEKRNRNTEISRYMSTKKVLFDYKENYGDRMWAGSRRAALDVLLGWLAALLGLDDEW